MPVGNFLSEDFLLTNKFAQRLYHEYAADEPIFDYHCHLPPGQLSCEYNFENLSKIWLEGDHYKWRAMRSDGVDERFITGDSTDEEKFKAWAKTVPNTMRNPLYHWTHMEMKKPFGISDRLLNPATADDIYRECTAMLQTPDFSTRSLLKKAKVKVVCTTDDPVDSLEHHMAVAKEKDLHFRMYPTFRPDKGMAVEDPDGFNKWTDKLEQVSGVEIRNFDSFLDAIRKRHDFFHSLGCRLSDHGIEQPYAEPCSAGEAAAIFDEVRAGKSLPLSRVLQFKSIMLLEFGVMDAEKGWTQQLHFGALRNNNSRMMKALGPDTGFDCIGDFEIAKPLSRFLDTLDSVNKLPKTIIYNLNPRDNELLGTMIGCFQGGGIPGKMQLGSGWWFLDQKDGMEKQMSALSNLGLLSRFVGMLTDSRSYLSYSRHEYFRRILCNLIGTDIKNGELPEEIEFLGETVKNICFGNAKNYFGLDLPEA